jgi:alkanesulfonate monooxygenase SsuD/methylene tetrahydromethanopterin reductase-like flavin-dependent oxidoreductase (luciferase family)
MPARTLMSERRWSLGISATPVFLDESGPVGAALARAGTAEVDFLTVGDHVSFRGGMGLDGLIHATAMLTAQDRLPVQVGVYLLALRHPVPVARQIADINRISPGRLRLAVGIGGEDRHEFEVCGVDPATRGQRTDEALSSLRPLLRGAAVSLRGKHFTIDNAVIKPAVLPELPLVIGGRSEAALRRAAAHGDGWLGMWVSARRFAEAVRQIGALAAAGGRTVERWQHGMTVWCSVDDDRRRAVDRLANLMTGRYGMPFEKFARWCPAGPPAEVAEFLAAYIAAGCRHVSLAVAADSMDEGLSAAERVRQALQSLVPA